MMFKVGDKIVYPMHGAGTIESIEEREILGEKQKYYIMKMPVGDIKVMVPTKNAELIVYSTFLNFGGLQNTKAFAEILSFQFSIFHALA